MLKNTYSYDLFFEIKSKNTYVIDPEIKCILEHVNSIIDNNYGISYHEKNKHKNKNYKNKSKNKQVPIMNEAQWRLKKTIIKKDINSDIDKYKYEINSLLNKMSPKNFDKISNKILEYYCKSISKEELELLLINFIDSIFLKAVMQPIYCPYYVKFLNILDEKYKILNLINEKCNNYRDIFIKSKETNDNLSKQEEYDKFCEDNLKKVFKAGYSQFIGELFNNKMIKIDIINSNINFFLESLNDNVENHEMFENIIICISKLLMTTTNELKALQYNYKEIYSKFNLLYTNYNDNKRLKYKLLDLCEYIEKIK
jgi:hypothetical protein